MRTPTTALALLALAATIAAAADADAPAPSPTSPPLFAKNCASANVTATGSGTTRSAPDEAVLTFTIASEKPTVADARADGADKLAAVQAALERAAAGAPVKTSFLSVQPVTTRPKEGEAPKTTAYSFRAGLTATLNRDGAAPTDLAAAAAAAVDAALAAGGDSTSVSGIQFRLSRAAAAKQATEARKLAAVDATTTARETAAALNLKLGPPRSIVVGRDGGASNVVPFAAAASAKAADGGAAAPTPLKVTDAETTASVVVVFGACEA